MIRLLAALLLFGVSLSAVEVHLNAVAASVTEGGSVTILATRSSNVGTLSVPVDLVVGAPTGVSLSAASFDFAAGATTATVALDTTDDADANGARQATAQITLSPGITSTNPAVTIGIRDDDVRVSITALDVLASEDALITDTAQLRIQLNDAGSGRTDTVQVQFEVQGTGRFEATGANDYTLDLDLNDAPTFTHFSIAPQDGIDVVSFDLPVGATEATITLTPLHDNAIEGGDTCIIRLPTASLAYTVDGIDNGTMTIADDDNRIVSVTSSPAFESGPDGSIGITFLSTFPTGPVSVPYLVSGVTNGTDITTLTGTASLPAGATHIDIPVDALPDAALEGDTLTFQLLPSPDYLLPGTPSVQLAIVDVAGTATIAPPASSAIEGVPGTPLIFPVTVSRFVPDFANYDVTVPFHLAGGTATSSEYAIGGTGVTWDSVTNSGVLILTGAATTGNISIAPVDDQVADGDKTVRVVLDSGQSVTVGSSSAATGTILDDEAVVSLTRSDSDPAREGGAGITFTVSYPGTPVGIARTQAVSARFTISGTAALGDRTISGSGVTLDGNGLGGTVTIPANELTTAITVTAISDGTAEPLETVTIALNTPAPGAAYRLGSAVSSSVNLIDDNGIVTLTGSPAYESGLDGIIGITFSSAFPSGLVVSVPYLISGVTNGTDIATLSGTATLAAGTTHIDIPIDAKPDVNLEGDVLTFQLLASPFYALPASPSILVDIVDVAGLATIAAPLSDAVEGDSGSPLLFPVSVSRLPEFANYDITVPFHIAGGTAASSEYTVGGTGVTWNSGAGTGVIVLAASATAGDISVAPVDDQIVDGDKTVRVVLDTGYSVTIGGAANATGTILDDEPIVSLTRIGADPATEGETGVTCTVSYPGTPSGVARTQTVTARFTISGTAALGDRTVSGSGVTLDSDGLGGTVTIPANELEASITVTAIADAMAESTETVVLTLSTPTAGDSYSLGSTVSASVDLVDAVTAPTVSISSISDAIEGRSVQCCRITRTGATTAALTVTLGSAGGSASAADYLALPTSITIPAGAPSATLAITAVADGPDNETIDVTLAADAAYVLGVDTASVAIVDGFADNQVALTSEPDDLVVPINADWSSICQLNLPTGLVAGRTRAVVVAVPGGSAPPSWLSVIHTSADTDTGVAVFTIVGSPPIGTTPGHVLVRLKVQADVDGDGTYELDIPQDLLLWVLDDGGAG